MASDYGRNFGFRRSDESVRNSEGRFRTPTTGNALLLGTAVQIDSANAGDLKVCAANASLIPGFAGLLVQEEIHLPSIYDAEYIDTYGIGAAKKGRLSVITTGAGTKVWFKNTGAETRADGRSIAAVTLVTISGVAVGDCLGWDGTYWAETATAAYQWMTVTAVDTTAGYCEAVLLK